MGNDNDGQHTTLEGITHALDGDRCDVCGRTKDVAQVIGAMESADPEMGGVATLQFICSYCAARIIQATTGFKAVKQLYTWYRVRELHPKVKPEHIHHWTDEEEIVV